MVDAKTSKAQMEPNLANIDLMNFIF